MKKTLHIGFDDTDSLKGSCTTYLGTLIVREIAGKVSFLDFPNLIRLNPNIPYKTRGNGAVAIRIQGESTDLAECKEIALKRTKELAEIDDENTNPGVVFLEGKVPSEIKKFSQRAMWDVLTIKEAEKFQSFSNIEITKYKLGRGIIGALGAIGNQLEDDFTFEHLSYRDERNFGTKRKVDEKSIIEADKATPLTFNNVDYEYNSIQITPRGADPVFAGIRGESVDEVMKAWKIVKPLEPIPMTMIYRTNQHTDQHFTKEFKIKDLKPHISAILSGIVTKKPFYIEGSHLIFSIKDETGKIDCAAYEPTKRFRGQLNNLIRGDEVRISGGIRPASEKHSLTVNIEKAEIKKLKAKVTYENPFCDKCGTRLKSAGKNKGYKCPKCSTRYRKKTPKKIEVKRELEIGLLLPPIIAHRHLLRPESRSSRDNSGKNIKLNDINQLLNELVKSNNQLVND